MEKEGKVWEYSKEENLYIKEMKLSYEEHWIVILLCA